MLKLGDALMSNFLHYFKLGSGINCISLPFNLNDAIACLSAIRSPMSREIPQEFTRDEWAYLIWFLEECNLRSFFKDVFGSEVTGYDHGGISLLLRPRGAIGMWLPNNVSLLGPLLLVMVFLTGNTIRIKTGSRSNNLVSPFFSYILSHIDNPFLKSLLNDRIIIEQFDRDDPRNAEMAGKADVRILFGSDEMVAQINNLPHPLGSIAFNFTDKRSEAWVEKDAVTDIALENIIKVFAIYGQSGCTSPRKIVLLDSEYKDAVELRDRLVLLWPKVINPDVQAHIASGNLMIRQWAAAVGGDSKLVDRARAVLTVGTKELPSFDGLMSLEIVSESFGDVIKSLPANVQTIGYLLINPKDEKWLRVLSENKIKRFVPIESMHHFGPVWDGYGFWRQMFEEVAII
jgi:hypothetical protein